jgi:hypothetical protein
MSYATRKRHRELGSEKERERMKSCVRILADATDAMRALGVPWKSIADLLRWAGEENR